MRIEERRARIEPPEPNGVRRDGHAEHVALARYPVHALDPGARVEHDLDGARLEIDGGGMELGEIGERRDLDARRPHGRHLAMRGGG